jgi:hypothetical protein
MPEVDKTSAADQAPYAHYYQTLRRLRSALQAGGIPNTPPWSRMIVGLGAQALVSRGVSREVFQVCVDKMLGMRLIGAAADDVETVFVSIDEPDSPVWYYDRISSALLSAGIEWHDESIGHRLMHVGLMGLRRFMPEHSVREAVKSAFAMAHVRAELMANKPAEKVS